MRFYSQSLTNTLNEYAVSFFALVNQMYRLQAREMLNNIVAVGAGMSGGESSGIIEEIKKQEKGLHGIVQEVRTLEKIKHVN